MSLLNTGSAVTENPIFNSGILTINGQKLADLEDITVTQEFEIKDLWVIGSIFSRAKRRTNFKGGAKFKALSFNMALMSYLYGSSAVDGSGEGYTLVDGQLTYLSGLAITTYVGNDTTQPAQFQFINGILKMANATLKKGDFAEVDMEIEATQIYLYNGVASLL